MSASVSAVSPSIPVYNPYEAPPIPKPTLSQQTHTLASTGLSVLEIATELAIPATQVDSALGIQTARPASPASTGLSAVVGLSIHA